MLVIVFNRRVETVLLRYIRLVFEGFVFTPVVRSMEIKTDLPLFSQLAQPPIGDKPPPLCP